jgi:hypothetical protein
MKRRTGTDMAIEEPARPRAQRVVTRRRFCWRSVLAAVPKDAQMQLELIE